MLPEIPASRDPIARRDLSDAVQKAELWLIRMDSLFLSRSAVQERAKYRSLVGVITMHVHT